MDRCPPVTPLPSSPVDGHRTGTRRAAARLSTLLLGAALCACGPRWHALDAFPRGHAADVEVRAKLDDGKWYRARALATGTGDFELLEPPYGVVPRARIVSVVHSEPGIGGLPGALIGGVVGGLGGALLGMAMAASADEDEPDEPAKDCDGGGFYYGAQPEESNADNSCWDLDLDLDFGPIVFPAVFGTLFGVIGAVAGGLIGAEDTVTRYTTGGRPTPKVGLAPEPGGGRVLVEWRF